MRQYEYQLTLTLPASRASGHDNGPVHLQEVLAFAGSDQGYARHLQIDPVDHARLQCAPPGARWTCEEESTSCGQA